MQILRAAGAIDRAAAAARNRHAAESTLLVLAGTGAAAFLRAIATTVGTTGAAGAMRAWLMFAAGCAATQAAVGALRLASRLTHPDLGVRTGLALVGRIRRDVHADVAAELLRLKSGRREAPRKDTPYGYRHTLTDPDTVRAAGSSTARRLEASGVDLHAAGEAAAVLGEGRGGSGISCRTATKYVELAPDVRRALAHARRRRDGGWRMILGAEDHDLTEAIEAAHAARGGIHDDILVRLAAGHHGDLTGLTRTCRKLAGERDGGGTPARSEGGRGAATVPTPKDGRKPAGHPAAGREGARA